MTKTFLLELGLEEMPAHVVTPSINQFEKRVTDFLTENRLTFGEVKKFSTPRRLALIINDLSDKQDDIDETMKGPAKRIALDSDGNWTKAAIGFAKGQGQNPEDIFFQELKGEEYAYIQKHEIGQTSETILQDINQPLEEMTFPTRMHWGSQRFEYIRPIHWLVAMLEDKVIDTQILNIKANNVTKGHRFLGHDEVVIKDVNSYVEALNSDFVIADANRRKAVIKQQIEAIATENDWLVDIDEDLLEEVNNLVEYPTAFFGNFDKKYLDIPDEVLITSMKDNQRYFYARTQDKKLAPVFISVRNGNDDYLENVISGNEKVLTARLEDAQFFYEEDQKHSIDFYIDKLKNVSFHQKIGSMYEKMQSTGVVAELLAKHLDLSAEEMEALKRASEISKFDLVTNMVDEFPELQGIMGEKYAQLMGENELVSKAISQHYMPTTAEGDLPESNVGAVLAVADKLDSIMSFFAVDIIPNGSNDPFGLRRQAYGIVRIMQARNWEISLDQLQDEIISNSEVGAQLTQHKEEVTDFIIERLRQYFKNEQMDHDIVETTLLSSTKTPTIIAEIAELLKNKREEKGFKETIESLSRIHKITLKNHVEAPIAEIDTSLFENDSENNLYDAVKELDTHINEKSIVEIFNELQSLSPMIDHYFEDNMILDKNEAVRSNRLILLNIIDKISLMLGDLSQLVIK
ncbi:glycine--tRNA ligase subunit beta [Lactobacillus sp. YT155]|uniref:glycine--tRNA ligase subunit beta n=1 Tax=Lactobacillus sp. YT155 TaxID=3060955 RepID=UPI00265FB014|nr:glycine--tRNA ligase subunit beta [Lactobacillus sp. YT155]MDO1605457.1 glycine--tRNA ligase subunit beta [Lactobacillus sp. YT155]